MSQALTLFTTPVTYLYMDRFSEFASRHLLGKKDHPPRKSQVVEARCPIEPVIFKNGGSCFVRSSSRPPGCDRRGPTYDFAFSTEHSPYNVIG